MDEFLTADCAELSCEEVTDEAIAGDVSSRQTTTLSDDSSDSDNEAGSGTLAPTSMSTEGALSSIDLLIDFMHSKGLPEVFAQQLESMHAAVVKLRLPRKQAKISDYLGTQDGQANSSSDDEDRPDEAAATRAHSTAEVAAAFSSIRRSCGEWSEPGCRTWTASINRGQRLQLHFEDEEAGQGLENFQKVLEL
ncbi:hypothetical protein HPB52_010490 [Rhipicephalus sanguineus]|uniref:Uncharacterized protein n=1 Tax=Rhipicephalus sanguineus TaxID=34632 RepID=A0A9D4PN25_RHISA|nr:hypothetical protein HPB52_010490 [Rhipicephalus sanguineus]